MASSGRGVEGKAALVEMLAQLPPRVVQRLVEGASRRVQPFRENVYRHAVQRQRNEHLTLVRSQQLADRVLQRGQELALLELGVGLEARAREQAPGLGLERDLPTLPRALSQLHGRLVEGELVDPRGEPTGATKVVELGQHADESVVRGVIGDVVEVVAT